MIKIYLMMNTLGVLVGCQKKSTDSALNATYSDSFDGFQTKEVATFNLKSGFYVFNYNYEGESNFIVDLKTLDDKNSINLANFINKSKGQALARVLQAKTYKVIVKTQGKFSFSLAEIADEKDLPSRLEVSSGYVSGFFDIKEAGNRLVSVKCEKPATGAPSNFIWSVYGNKNGDVKSSVNLYNATCPLDSERVLNFPEPAKYIFEIISPKAIIGIKPVTTEKPDSSN